METSPINDKTFLALIMGAEGDEIEVSYGIKGCQDVRRNALYTWMREAINLNKKRDIDFLEIMVVVVEQLKEDYPHLKKQIEQL